MSNKTTLTPERVAEIKARPIDFSDIPELTREDFARGYFRNQRPRKKFVTVRIDKDILSWLKADNEKGYQKRLNAVLRWAKNKGYTI